jgi:UDP-N-acetylglucosamine--N-acetylmuramyl-(pentapeptide) pyrophosphoryl-undecaprenol N-acetylglucosamine transferase
MRLLIAGGASGGHITAALAVAHAFRASHPDGEVLIVGRAGGPEDRLVPASRFELATIVVRGLDRDAAWKNLALPVILPWALFRGGRVLERFRPDVALGVGAYAMVPCLWAALRRAVPYVLQVSEASGLANRMLRSGAAAACLSFATDLPAFSTPRTLVTGYPIRPGFAPRRPRVPPRRLLVMGGSLGARRLNEAVWDGLDRLLARFEEVVHLTGTQGEREAGALARPGYRPISTTTDVPRLMSEADLVVSRAGLGTCAELMAVGLPAILVPGRFGGAHQEENAEKLVAAGAAVRVADEELTAGRLLDELRLLAPGRLRAMAAAAAGMGRPDAAQRIVRVLEDAAGRPRGRPAGLVRAGVSVVAGALGSGPLASRSGPVAGGGGGVDEVFRQAELAELGHDLAQEERAEVVRDVLGVAGGPVGDGAVALAQRPLGLQHGEPGTVVPVVVHAP